MAVAVVLDAVAATRDFLHELGLSSRVFADAEEARFRLVAIEQVQNAGRHFGVGTVVESERNLPAALGGCGQAHQVRTQQLSARPQHCEKEREMIRPQHTQHPCPCRRMCDEPDGRCSVQKHRDMNRRRRPPAPAVFAADCGGGTQDRLSARLCSQTSSPASTGVAPTLQLKLILFSSRLEKSMDTRSPGRTGRMNLADRIWYGQRSSPRLVSIARSASLSSSAPGMIGFPGKCPCAAA